MLALAVVLSPGVTAQQRKPASPLPANIVAAWEKAGAQAGWFGPNEFGYHVFHYRKEGTEGEVPIFAFKHPHFNMLGELPQPESGFGLELVSTQVTDAWLKRLARGDRLKFLQTLNLYATNVTDAGLKELAGLTSLDFELPIGRQMAVDDVGDCRAFAKGDK
jgi:hypothetical protein